MTRKLIIDGSAVYEVDEECMLKKRNEEDEKRITQEKNTYMEEYKKAMRRTE